MSRAVVLFPGQGAQHRGMAVDLYARHGIFHAAMDEVLALWGSEGAAIRADWLGDDPVLGIDDYRRSQPLLFAIGHALATVVREEGIEPAAVLGHSVGEVVAAVVAGVLTLSDAAAMVMDRITHLADAPAGGMLGVAASAQDVAPLLVDDVSIAAVNSARQVMLAGPDQPLDHVRARLAGAGFTTQRVRSTLPFHSPVLAGHAARCVPALKELRLCPPNLPMYSGYTGSLLGAEATEPGFWASQLTNPVLFADALDRVADRGRFVYVDAGNGQLAILARRHPRITRAGGAVVTLLPPRGRGAARDLPHLAGAIADIHAFH